MSDFLEEVDEGMRQDRATLLWKRFGPLVWLAGILLVSFVAWREYTASVAAKAQLANVQRFEEARDALAGGEYGASSATLSELAGSDAVIAPLAAHLLARARYEGEGDAAAAIAALEAAGSEGEPFRRLAILKAAYLKADTLDLAELEAALGPLLEDEGALGALALELLAARAYATGNFERAREEFSYLRFAANAPQGVVQRAELALSVIPVTASASGLPGEPPSEAAGPEETLP